jgi:hypothetical protein
MISNQHHFYLISELLISLIGGFLLLAIWLTIQKQFKQKLTNEVSIKRLDKGLLYLSLSVFVWAFSSLITFINSILKLGEWTNIISQNLFSILNSLFLILALFYLDNAPQYLYNNKKSTKRIILFLIALSVLSFLLALFFKETINTYGIRFNTIPDLILSAVLAWFLIVSLYRTFLNRNMTAVAIISILALILLFLSQIPFVFRLGSFDFYTDLIRLIAKSTLIAVFLVLGTSWVIELSQIPEATTMKIHFTDWNQLVLSIPSKNIINQKIEFGNKTTQFNNLLKFAVRRKYAPEDEMCIEVFNGGELPSQTYLSRIIDNINQILDLKDENKLSRNDLFTFIGQAKYRLRFLANHITIDSALLKEFTHNVNNEKYKQFYS